VTGSAAFLGRGRSRSFLLLRREAVDLLDQEEDGEGHDHEVDHRVEKHAIIQGGSPSGFGSIQARIALAAEIEEEIGEVYFPQQQADGRHENVGHKRRDDFAKRRADDDPDAMSSTFPRMANSLNSFNMMIPLSDISLTGCFRKTPDGVICSQHHDRSTHRNQQSA